MKFKVNSYLLFTAVIVFYLAPVIFFSSYSIGLMTPNKSWNVLNAGLLLCVGCSIIFFILMRIWEDSLKQKNKGSYIPSEEIVPSSSIYSIANQSIEEEKQRADLLEKSLKESQNEIQLKAQELQKSLEEQEYLHKQALRSSQELAEYKIFSEEQLNQKNLLIQSLQLRFSNQQEDLEAKQEKISQFESKIRDLSYEIKTLLQLNESEIKETEKIKKKAALSNSPDGYVVKETSHHYHIGEEQPNITTETNVRSPAEASLLLKRCIDIAQKITGANYHSLEGARPREITSQSYAIDLRRLFDSLRSENASLILVYSQKEDKLLFVNNMSKSLLGWSPEKFVQDFQSIMQKSTVDWKNALSHVASHYEANTQVLMKTKTGSELQVRCQLGTIPIGLFKGYVIGVFYPASAT